jgi:hypothetical protein
MRESKSFQLDGCGQATRSTRSLAKTVGRFCPGAAVVLRLHGKVVKGHSSDRFKNRSLKIQVEVFCARLSGSDNIVRCDFFKNFLGICRYQAGSALQCECNGEPWVDPNTKVPRAQGRRKCTAGATNLFLSLGSGSETVCD